MILIWFQITFGGIDFDLISNHILGDFRWFWFLEIQNQFMMGGLEIFKNKFLISWCFATKVTFFGFFFTFCNNNKWDSRANGQHKYGIKMVLNWYGVLLKTEISRWFSKWFKITNQFKIDFDFKSVLQKVILIGF